MKKVSLFLLFILYVNSALSQIEKWAELDSMVNSLFRKRAYAEALKFAGEEALVAEKTFGNLDPRYALSLNNLGLLYYSMNQLSVSDSIFSKVINVYSKNKIPEDKTLTACLKNSSLLKIRIGKYAEAEQLIDKVIILYNKVPGYSNQEKAKAYDLKANVLLKQGKTKEAEKESKMSLNLMEQESKSDSSSITDFLFTCARIKKEERKNDEAEELLIKYIYFIKKKFGENSAALADPFNLLGDIYLQQVKYTESEFYFKASLAIREKELQPNDPKIAESINNLANLYTQTGNYSEADKLFGRADEIMRNKYGANYPNRPVFLNTQASINRKLGRFDEADRLFKEAIYSEEANPHVNHLDLSSYYNNLAELYSEKYKYSEAEKYYKKSLQLKEERIDKDNPALLMNLLNLFSVILSQNKTESADSLLSQAMLLKEKYKSELHPVISLLYENLARFYIQKKNLSEAEKCILKAILIKEKTLGQDHPDLIPVLYNIAVLYQEQGRMKDADIYYDKAINNLHIQFRKIFSYASEQDKLSYLKMMNFYLDLYYNFAFYCSRTDPSKNSKIYDCMLWQKGIVVTSVSEVFRDIYQIEDVNSQALLSQLKAVKDSLLLLSQILFSDYNDYLIKYNALSKKNNDIEKRLSSVSKIFKGNKEQENITWKNIQANLKNDEAAIEMVAFKKLNRKITDTVLYYAIIIKAQSKIPEIIFIGESGIIDNAVNFNYRLSIQQSPVKRTLKKNNAQYSILWKPFEKYLDGIRNIYISPDGILNQVSYGTLLDDEGRFLTEKYEFRYLSNTKDLAFKETPINVGGDIILIGNPDFTDSKTKPENVFKESSRDSAREAKSVRNKFKNLPAIPGTEIEIKEISKLLSEKNIKSTSFLGKIATEEQIKRTKSPQIVHIATHGFFEPYIDEDYSQLQIGQLSGNRRYFTISNPMLNSGLLFSFPDENNITSLNDGVLTAYEAAMINLHGTDLVVLSACETGLGQYQIGEGVFGLRRAFQIAGANTVIMSLWSVPDTETREMMVLFYKKYFSGLDKGKSFASAQNEMKEIIKKRYGSDIPFYWGAFIMVGK